MKLETSKLFFESEEINHKNRGWVFFLILLGSCFTFACFLSIILIFIVFIANDFTYLVQNIWKFFFLVFILSSFISLFVWIYIHFYGIQSILSTLEVKEIDPKDQFHQIYQNILEEIGISSGELNLVPLILPTTSLNCFSFSDRNNCNVIVLTEGAISKLSRTQMQALVAQSVARGIARDGQVEIHACALLQLLSKIPGSWGQFILILLGEILYFFLSQESLLRADAGAIRLTRDPLSLAEALHICENSWTKVSVSDRIVLPLFAIPPLKDKFLFISKLFSYSSPPVRIEKILKMANETEEVLRKVLEKPNNPVFLTNNSSNFAKWYIQLNKKWIGPYSIQKIFQEPWFHPELWIRKANEKFESPTYAHPDLDLYFQGKMPSSSLKCPACGGMFINIQRVGIEVKSCYKCHGVWAMDNQVLRLICRRERSFSEKVVQEAQHYPNNWQEIKEIPGFRQDKKTCPACFSEMRNIPYRYSYPVPIDKCDSCSHTWFDENELEILQYLMDYRKVIDFEKEEKFQRKNRIEKAKIDKKIKKHKPFSWSKFFISFGRASLFAFSFGFILFTISLLLGTKTNSFLLLGLVGFVSLLGFLAGLSMWHASFSKKELFKILWAGGAGFFTASAGILSLISFLSLSLSSVFLSIYLGIYLLIHQENSPKKKNQILALDNFIFLFTSFILLLPLISFVGIGEMNMRNSILKLLSCSLWSAHIYSVVSGFLIGISLAFISIKGDHNGYLEESFFAFILLNAYAFYMIFL